MEYYGRNLIIYANKYFVKCIEKFIGQDAVNTIFHYTTTEVFDKIITNATFRASNIFYLNDSKEYVYGVEKLKEKIDDNNLRKLVDNISKSDGKSFPGLYTISFSKEADSLHQWITYSKESGVAMELDYNLLQKNDESKKIWLLKQDIEECEEGGFLDASIIKPLKYIPENSKVEDFNRIWDDLFKEEDETPEGKNKEIVQEITLRMLASHIKSEDFKSEAEVRIATFPMILDKNCTKLNYFHTKGILRPYIDISFGCEEKNAFVKKLPIKSVVVGPSGRQQMVFDSVVHRMIYGKNSVYQYELKELSKNIESYCELIEKKTNKISRDSVKFDWYEKNKMYLCENLGETEENIKKALGITSKESLTEEEIKSLHNLYKDFCFTKEGIIIRKSTIPYIF